MEVTTLAKLTNMPWAVSGRRWTMFSSERTGPMWVSNMRLNMRGGVSFPAHSGQTGSAPEWGSGDWVPASAGTTEGLASSWSSRQRRWQTTHSTSGSVKLSTCRWPSRPRVHDDGGVEADHVVALEDHGTPPGVLDVALELGAERAVVPGAGQASVYLAVLEDEASAFAEGYELVQVYGHALLRVGGVWWDYSKRAHGAGMMGLGLLL